MVYMSNNEPRANKDEFERMFYSAIGNLAITKLLSRV